MFAYLYVILSTFTIYRPPVHNVETLSLQELQSKTLHPDSDTLYIVNFWATWCKPCIKELPFFENAGTKFANKPVKILLVSLDMLSDIHKVDQFVQSNDLRNEVFLLQAGNPDHWINAIDHSWSGAIPATAFYKAGKKIRFHEGDFNQQELFTLIQSITK